MPPLFTITFLVPFQLLDAAILQLPSGVQLGIRVDAIDNFSTDAVYRTLFFNRIKHAVCIALPAEMVPNEKVRDAVLPLFNHPQYMVHQKNPVLILTYSAINAPAVKHVWNTEATGQGWAGLHRLHFFKTPYCSRQGATFSWSVSAIEQAKMSLENQIEDLSQIMGADFLIEIPDLHVVSVIIETLSKTEQEFRNRHTKLYETYTRLMVAATEAENAKEQLAVCQRQLENLRKYNAILKSEKETERILNFYHGEYEVLPLWYKRFGHIIKVMTGKRTFASLFHNAKKHT